MAQQKRAAFHAAFQPLPSNSEEPVDHKVSHLEAQDNIEVTLCVCQYLTCSVSL